MIYKQLEVSGLQWLLNTFNRDIFNIVSLVRIKMDSYMNEPRGGLIMDKNEAKDGFYEFLWCWVGKFR